MAKNKKEKINPIVRTLFLFLFTVLIIRFIAGFFPTQRIWGINQSAYIDQMFWLYIILAGFSILIYNYGGVFIKRLESIEYNYRNLLFVSGLIWLISISFFYLFRAQAHFLGDGYQLISRLAQPNLILKPISYGESILHVWVAKLIGVGSRADIYDSFRILSLISGTLFLVTIFYYGRKITDSFASYLIFIFLNLFSIFVILFFGYVETYSIVTAVLFLSFYSSALSLQKERLSPVPIISYAGAVFLHQISLVYLPAFLMYLMLILGGRNLRQRLTRNSLSLAIILTSLILTSYTLIILFAPLDIKNKFLSPLAGQFTTDNYYLLSPAHIIDYFNILVWILPILIIAIILRVKYSVQSELNSSNGANLFFIFATLSGLWGAFILEPKLGMPRDWDLFSTMLIGAFTSGIWLWLAYFGKRPGFQKASLFLIILLISIFLPWLSLINYRPGFYKYAISVMQLDPHHSRTGIYTILSIQQRLNNRREVENLAHYCELQFPEMKLHREGLQLMDEGSYEKAIGYFRQAINLNPAFYGPYHSRGLAYRAIGDYNNALNDFLIADALNPYNSEINYDIGMLYKKLNDKNRMLQYWARSLKYDRFNNSTKVALAGYYNDNGLADSSINYISSIPDTVTLKDNTDYFLLGNIWLSDGDSDRAIKFFNRFLKEGGDSALIDSISSLKSKK